jgi:signal transduction histidine kinase
MIGAAQDISERKRLEQELLQKELDRQKLISQATIDTQEQERAEIGKELHDNVNQILTTTKLYLEIIQSSPDMSQELLTKANQNIINVINEIRQLSRSLMDPSLGDLGLVDSVKDLIENINLTRSILLTFTATESLELELDASRKLMVFRIIQEAVNNIIRHAKATEGNIILKKIKNTVRLKITDNGIGFNPGQIRKGIGIKNITNRVYLTNGQLHIQSRPGKGTTLDIKIPIQKSPN